MSTRSVWNKGLTKENNTSLAKMADTRKAQGSSWNRGLVRSEETKQKIRDAKRGTAIGEKNPFWGRRHSIESKLKNRLAHLGRKMSAESVEKIRSKNIGSKRTDEQKEHIRRGVLCSAKYRASVGNLDKIRKIREKRRLQKQYYPTKEVKERMSLAAIGRIQRGSSHYLSGRFYSRKNCRMFSYRSSYELIAMRIFEQMSTVLKYEYETLSIPYVGIGGIKKNTIPDFLVYYADGSRELIEVKPEYKIRLDSSTAIKLKALGKYAKSNNMKFSVWSERHLNIK